MGAQNSGVNIFAGIPPLTLERTGRVFFVGNGATAVPGGSTGVDSSAYGDSPQAPFATWDYAIGNCVANRGDTIFLMPRHAETISAAGGIAHDVAGVAVIGLGFGANRPTITFSNTASSILITAANTSIKNVVGTPSVDSVTNPFHVQAADCELDIEWQDASSTVEAVRAVLGTAAADRLKVKLRYVGNVSGDAVVNAIRLVGTNQGRIEIDFYGICTTAVVEFVTTACTDILVNGYCYVSGTTSGALNVVNTGGIASTWYSDIVDGAAGARFTGGSAAAVASDDITAITSALYGTAGVVTWPTAAAYANAVSIAEVLGYIQDGVRRGTGTTLPANASLSDYTVKCVSNTTGTLVNGTTIFTIAGGPIEILSLVARCVTGNDGTASTLQWSADPTDGAAATISGASASLASATAGALVALQGTALSTAALLNATGVNLGSTIGTIVGAGIITTTIAAGSTTGTWQHHMAYRPLALGVTVT